MFGQQYTSPMATAAKWIFFGFFGVILMGFLLGANLKDATWLNRDIASAEARRIEIENAHQQAMYQLNEQLATAQTQAEIRQIERQQALLDAQYQHDIQALRQELVHKDLAFRTLMTALTILVCALAVASIIWVMARAIAHVRTISRKEESMPKPLPAIEKRIPNLAERIPYDALNRNQALYSRRLDERLEEIAADRGEISDAEWLAARMRALSNPAQMSSEEYKKRPLAGD